MQLDNKTKIKIDTLLKNSTINIDYQDFKNIINKTEYKDEDVIEYLLNKLNKELCNNNIIKITKINYSINTILLLKIPLSESVLNKINQVIINNEEMAKHQILKAQINQTKTVLTKNYPDVELNPNKNESNLEDEKIKTLKETLKKANDKIIELDTKLKKQNKNYEHLKTQKNELNELKVKLENKIIALEKIKLNQEEKIISLQDEINNLSEENQNLSYNKERLLELENNTKALEEQNNKEKIAIGIILRSLYKNKKTNIEEIMSELNKEKIKLTSQEIYIIINNMKQTFNIKGPIFDTIPPYYEIDTNISNTHNTFYYNIEDYDQQLNILVISDMHNTIDRELEELKKLNNIIYNYCQNNNIKLIFNLGDTFDINKYNRLYNEEKIYYLNEIKELIDKYIESLPSATDIYQILLGGNHDKFFIDYGINPLTLISSKREDIVNLGYDYGIIELGNINNQILLHHPSYRLEEENEFSDEIKNYLDIIYEDINSKNNIYFNLIGHLHRSKMDFINNYCLVPSYTKDRVKNGGWHLKLYFNNNHEIDHINFISLITEAEKLIPTTEISYYKARKK